MEKSIDYIFAKKVDLNEGLTTGTVTKAAVYFTKNYFFVIPLDSINIWSGSDTDYNNAKDFIKDMNKKANEITIEEFQNELIDFLPNERVYKVDALDKFQIQVGFWIFGGMRIRKPGEQLQAFNVQPKSLRAELQKFYGLSK